MSALSTPFYRWKDGMGSMFSQDELREAPLIGIGGPRIWADQEARRGTAARSEAEQTKMGNFLAGGTLLDEEMVEEQWDGLEWQRTISQVLRHDLLNKLTVAQGGLELFDRSGEAKFLDMARRNMEACGEIVTKLATLENSYGPMELTPMDVAGMAERVLRLNQGRGVEIKLMGRGWAMADGAMFNVLENLVSNAIWHAAPTIVRIDIEEKGHKVRVKVTDDGNGIPAEAREGLFKEGFKFGPKGNTGLGLFIVKRIVQRYGGSIWVEENMPKGTVFCIELRKPVRDMPVE